MSDRDKTIRERVAIACGFEHTVTVEKDKFEDEWDHVELRIDRPGRITEVIPYFVPELKHDHAVLAAERFKLLDRCGHGCHLECAPTWHVIDRNGRCVGHGPFCHAICTAILAIHDEAAEKTGETKFEWIKPKGDE